MRSFLSGRLAAKYLRQSEEDRANGLQIHAGVTWKPVTMPWVQPNDCICMAKGGPTCHCPAGQCLVCRRMLKGGDPVHVSPGRWTKCLECLWE